MHFAAFTLFVGTMPLALDRTYLHYIVSCRFVTFRFTLFLSAKMFSLAFITLFYMVHEVLHAAHMLASCCLLENGLNSTVSETELEKYVR